MPALKQFQASDGYGLHYRHWQPSIDTPRGYVVALHGIQSHSGWYEYSSGRLCEAGYDVRFLDRRGSGANELLRGYTPHHERLINDVVQFLAEVSHQRNQQAAEIPVILLGVSWGGKLAAVTCALRGEYVDALALLYPGICARVRPTPLQRFQLQLAERLGIRKKTVPIPLDDPRLFTGEAEWQKYIREDPLALREATVSLLNASVQLDRLAEISPARIQCPVLLLLAGKDRSIDNDATRHYFGKIASSDKESFEYPQAEHTLEFEPNREAIVSDLLKWMRRIRSEQR